MIQRLVRSFSHKHRSRSPSAASNPTSLPYDAPPGFWNEEAYLSFNPDVKAALEAKEFPNGWHHFRRYGRLENRQVYVPADWHEDEYLAKYPAVRGAIRDGFFVSGYHHFKSIGENEGKKGATKRPPLWDETGYLTLNPEAKALVSQNVFADGLQHYENVGRRNGARLPVPTDWDESFYLAKYPPIANGVANGYFQSGFEHYLFHGSAEGRLKAEPMPIDWDDASYLALHSDAAQLVKQGKLKSGWVHFQLSGRSGGNAIGVNSRLVGHLRDISRFEPSLYPSAALQRRLQPFNAMRRSPAARIYASFLETIADRQISHMFAIPWMKAGGADRVALQHIEAVAEATRRPPIVILTDAPTDEAQDIARLKRLRERAIVFQIPADFTQLDGRERGLVFARMVTCTHASVLHNINSSLAWQCICDHGAALSNALAIFCSVFAFGLSPEGERVGYVRLVPDAAPFVKRFLSDNDTITHVLSDLYGLDVSSFKTIKYPVAASRRFAWKGSRKLLWASRLDREKRLDILLAIAQLAKDFHFDVFGTAALGGTAENEFLPRLRRLPNVTYRGAFSGFDSIPTADYMALLYTSESDGMPNILIEAQAAGLAVLAPNVGGISELIPPKTGFLIDRFDDVASYGRGIRKMASSPSIVTRESDRAFDKICSERNWNSFMHTLMDIPDYGSDL